MGGPPDVALQDVRCPVVVGVTSLLELPADDRGDGGMGLADELAAIPPNHRGRPSITIVERIIASFDGEDRTAMEDAFKNPARFPAARLADFLADKGFKISRATISDWRRRNGHR